MDVTMDIEVEHQITQPEPQINVMKTCYEEPPQRRPTQQKRSRQEHKLKIKVNNNTKAVIHSSRDVKTQGRRTSKEIKSTTSQTMD